MCWSRRLGLTCKAFGEVVCSTQYVPAVSFDVSSVSYGLMFRQLRLFGFKFSHACVV